jgi:hypothetical protein
MNPYPALKKARVSACEQVLNFFNQKGGCVRQHSTAYPFLKNKRAL